MADETAKTTSNEEPQVQPADMDAYPVLADMVQDSDYEPHIGVRGIDEFEDQVVLERHNRARSDDPSHVDLSQEEYTPQEVARLIGTSLEVVMHAIWGGELNAQREGKDVVCITHGDVTDWLRRREAE